MGTKQPVILPAPQKITMEGDAVFTGKVSDLSENLREGIPAEGYILKITETSITAEASDDAGIFYAKKTLEQLQIQYGDALPCMTIEDAPKYPYRSFHLDCARHFIPLEELKKNIACAASFKLNHFHWHFSDDQGYRIESKVLPLLTEISSKRKGDHFGGNTDDTEEQHYYTQKEVRDLVAFAAEHHVEVVPEIDMPGHVTAILAAYPQLSCKGETLEVATSEGIFSDILCAGKEETYEFMEKLLGELAELFPGKYFHIGGDETPKTAWKSCPVCAKRMEEEGLGNFRQLQGYLQNRVAAFLQSKGKTVLAWNEAALGGNLNPDIVLQLWNDDPQDPGMKAFNMKDEKGNYTSPNQGIGAKHIAKGGRVINTNMLHSYCDYPHAFVKAKNIYETDMVPQKCEALAEDLVKAAVMGGEALCWTEHIRDAARLEYMIWPRYAVKADALWSQAQDRNFAAFKKQLKTLYAFLKAQGVQPASEKEFIPGPIESGKQMLEFMKRLGGASNADKYAEANREV